MKSKGFEFPSDRDPDRKKEILNEKSVEYQVEMKRLEEELDKSLGLIERYQSELEEAKRAGDLVEKVDLKTRIKILTDGLLLIERDLDYLESQNRKN